METISFADTAIVACGTMSLELNYLRDEGFLNTPQIFYTTPTGGAAYILEVTGRNLGT